MKLTPTDLERYDRHLLLDEIGVTGQEKLHNAKVLVIGAGGLGCPALLYLTAAGVGTIGIVDFDAVELSNLQRQILFTVEDIGKPKSVVAASRLSALNPSVKLIAITDKLTVDNAINIIKHYDIVLDASDNFPTRYLLNDACVLLEKPLIYGAIYKFNGQVAVFNQMLSTGERSSTYRCLFPEPPTSEASLNCSEVGVLGVLPGIIGTLQAAETIKLIVGFGSVLSNSLLIFDSKEMAFETLRIDRNESCWVNYPSTIHEFNKQNYQVFCHSPNVKSVDCKEFDKWVNNPGLEIQILDVREPNEQPEISFINSVHIPTNELDLKHQKLNPETLTVVFCAEGNRSALAVKMLSGQYGFKNIFNLKDGIKKWISYNQSLQHEA
jgi:sulfur-carrier protein adenylyltransferase/sulfurtransferase